ncbi:hypothetical protein [Nesterenkonia ebinurensis]|uniref:hypothetical protein n=1 Tax=Nesterenkonia ebinurensis TaxID=2608252 RepID=UPI00123CC4FD|nr:hypothetical protein [Nesterenkonia ebinurensis]
MAEDPGPSKITDIERRLEHDHSWISRYQAPLTLAGVIEPAGRGLLRFTLPYLSAFLTEHGQRY